MASLSIFANFWINSQESLQRMKDTFMSFKSINAEQWVINIRGQHKKEAGIFLEEHLGPRLVLFQLESPEGWFYDSRIMAEKIHTQYVLFWIEDHFNLVQDTSKYDDILSEMDSAGVEYLPYSWFSQMKSYVAVPKKELKNIHWLDLTKNIFKLVLKKDPGAYIVSHQSISSTPLFKKIIFSDDEKQAFKWPKETPFDFEKSSHDLHWLPMRVGLPKYELFVSIDDDSQEPGSSLISRGLYPEREKRRPAGVVYANTPKPLRSPKRKIKDKIKSKLSRVLKSIFKSNK